MRSILAPLRLWRPAGWSRHRSRRATDIFAGLSRVRGTTRSSASCGRSQAARARGASRQVSSTRTGDSRRFKTLGGLPGVGAAFLADTCNAALKVPDESWGALRANSREGQAMDAHRMSPIRATHRLLYPFAGASLVMPTLNEAANLSRKFARLALERLVDRHSTDDMIEIAHDPSAARVDGGRPRYGRLDLTSRRRCTENGKVRRLATWAAASYRFGWRDDDSHRADRGDVELEALSTAQSRSVYHLDFGPLVVPIADPVDGFRPERDSASEFTDSELRGRRHATKYIASGLQKPTGVDR